jgi:hypothetical protein
MSGGFDSPIPALDLSPLVGGGDISTIERRSRRVTKDPVGSVKEDPRLLLAPDLLSAQLVQSPTERSEELSDLLGNIGDIPDLPQIGDEETDEAIRLRKKAASDRAKRRTGRQSAIKTSSHGLPEDDQLNIARATLTG